MLPPSGDISECIEKKKASGYKRVLFFSSFFQQIFTACNVAGKVRSTGKIKKKKRIPVLEKQDVENKICIETHLGTFYLKHLLVFL